jgi:hypothetical protein
MLSEVDCELIIENKFIERSMHIDLKSPLRKRASLHLDNSSILKTDRSILGENSVINDLYNKVTASPFSI